MMEEGILLSNKSISVPPQVVEENLTFDIMDAF